MEVSVKDLLVSIDEAKQSIAVKRACIGFLKTRYMSRDGLPPQSFIKYDRSTVTEDVIYEVVTQMEKEVDMQEQKLKATLEERIDG